MNKKTRKIRSDFDFQNCIYFDSDVGIWVGGELDNIGKIQNYSYSAVKVSGYSYLREVCEFRVVEK